MKEFEKVILKCDKCGNIYSKDLEFDKVNMTLTCKVCRSTFTLLDKTDKPDELRKLIEQQSCDNKEAYERLVAMYNEQKDKTGEVVLKIDTAIGYISDIKSDLQKLHQEVASQGEDLKKLNQKATSQGEDLKRLNQKAFVQGEEIKKQGIKIDGVVNRFDQETDNLRTLLREAMSEQYVSGEKIKDIAKDLLTKDGNDFLANFCNAVYSDNAQKVNAILDKIDEKQDKSDVELIIKFLINDLNSKNVSSLKNLVNKQNLQTKYLNKIEEEAEKVSEGIYNPKLKRDIFVAFAGADEDRVVPIVNYFEEQEFTCYFSLRNLRHGKDAKEKYWPELQTALENSKCVVFMSSNNSRSQDCDALDELAYVEMLNNKPEFNIGMFEFILDDYSKNISKLMKDTLKEYFNDSTHYKDINEISKKIFKYIQGIKLKRKFNIDEEKEVESDKAEQQKNIKPISSAKTNDLSVQAKTEVAATIEKGNKTADLSEANTKKSNTTEILKTNASPVLAKTEEPKPLSKTDTAKKVTQKQTQTVSENTKTSVPKITLSNYDKDEFEIEGTELVKYKGNKSKVVIPEGVERIGGGAFKYCYSLTSIEIPSGVTSIGGQAFWGCSSLTSVEIPSSVTRIGGQAFWGCSRLTSIEIPSSVTSIGFCAFWECISLTIYCEADKKPSGWYNNWNASYSPVKWGYKKNNSIQSPKTDTAKKQSNKSTQNVTLAQAKEWCLKGDDYYFGKNGVSKDYEKAVYWYTKSAEQGYARAQNNLGCCYQYGQGVVKDLQKAVYWYTKAAEQGDATAQYNLGYCYYYGEGVAKDLQKAVYWYTKAAEQGYASAQNNLGCCYYYGQGVAKDYTKAVYWYTKSAEQGHARAQNNLGYCYESGQGVAKDLQKAVYWFTKAAEQGHATAQYNLGYCYESGQGVAKDLQKAVYWYTKAAEQGHADGQNNLGYCYQYGQGVVKDLQEAMYWYTKAAEQGHANAKLVLQKQTQMVSENKKTSVPKITLSNYDKDEFEIEGTELVKYKGNKSKVVIPEGVERIGGGAFKDCYSLTSIEIPSSVTSIGGQAFWGCSRLTSVEIPSGVTSIGDLAFEYCSSLTSVEIPSSVTSIGKSAFWGCSNLTSIKISRGLTSIGDLAFYGCRRLTSIEIPSSVTSIGDMAFEYCSSLTSVEIPSGVTSIGKSAFWGCSNLTSIKISRGLTSIGDRAFHGCRSLTSITVESSNPKYKSDGNCIIEKDTNKLVLGCNNSVIPNYVTSIANYAFYGCSELTSIEIPSSVTSIANYAFLGCSSLTSVEIPSGVTSIAGDAFHDCSKLTSIEIPSGVTSIGGQAFMGCSSLTSVVIPSSVTSIGNGAFHSCSSLTSVEISSSVTSIGKSAFWGCSNLTSIKISRGLTSIGDRAFHSCSSLTSIKYNGTKKAWKAINQKNISDWKMKDRTIYCTDGTIKCRL